MRIKRAHLSNKAFLLASALVLIEGVLYVLIHSDGIGYNRELSYLSVIAAAGFSFASISTREREDYFVALGMLITLVADLFLVVCEPQRKLAGVITFLFAEVVYFLYIHFREQKRLRKAHLYALISVGALALAAPPIVLGDSFDILALVSVAYYALLILNVVFSFLDKELLLFSIALVDRKSVV